MFQYLTWILFVVHPVQYSMFIVYTAILGPNKFLQQPHLPHPIFVQVQFAQHQEFLLHPVQFIQLLPILLKYVSPILQWLGQTLHTVVSDLQ